MARLEVLVFMYPVQRSVQVRISAELFPASVHQTYVQVLNLELQNILKQFNDNYVSNSKNNLYTDRLYETFNVSLYRTDER